MAKCRLTMLWLVTLVLVTAAPQAQASGYCSNNTFNTNSTFMQFTKEPIAIEYGFQGKFKSIHCCVKDYRSIEWFKDGVAYPWSAGTNFILYPEEANQTLYAHQAAAADAGRYTCRLTNDTHSLNHTLTLTILDKPVDVPKVMYVSPNQSLAVGDVMRLYCETLVGQSYLADARSDISWHRVGPNGTKTALLPWQKEIKSARVNMNEIIGASLNVERVSPADFGKYACEVHNNGFISSYDVLVSERAPDEVLWSVWNFWRAASNGTTAASRRGWVSAHAALVAAGAAAALALAVLAGAACRVPRARLAAKVARARLAATLKRAKGLDKEFDVLVCWTAVDAELVRGALLPTLTLKYKYRVNALQVNTKPDKWCEELYFEMSRCRSLVAVVSPAQHSAAQILVAMRQLHALPAPGKPIIVLLQDMPADFKKEGPEEIRASLVALLRRSVVVAWRRVHEPEFWTRLRLALPTPPLQLLRIPNESETRDNRDSCSGSRTALV